MTLLRSGVVLFICVTLVATLLSVLFYGNVFRVWREGWTPDDWYVVTYAGQVSLITAPTALILTVAAWRGRRRLLLHGIISTAVTGIPVYAYLHWLASNSEDPISRSYAALIWLFYAKSLAAIIPALVVTYFALRRTPLLRGLVPQKTELKAWLDQRP